MSTLSCPDCVAFDEDVVAMKARVAELEAAVAEAHRNLPANPYHARNALGAALAGTPTASVSVLEVPYRPCTIHGGYDPSLKQCPGCLDAKLVDAPRPSDAESLCTNCGETEADASKGSCPGVGPYNGHNFVSYPRTKEATVAQDWIDDPSGIPAPIACPRGPYGTCAWARRSECATHRTNEATSGPRASRAKEIRDMAAFLEGEPRPKDEPVRPDQTKYVITCDDEPRTDSALTVLDRLLQCFTEADDGLQTDNLEKVASAIVWGQEIVRKAQRTEPALPESAKIERWRRLLLEAWQDADWRDVEDVREEMLATARTETPNRCRGCKGILTQATHCNDCAPVTGSNDTATKENDNG